MAYDRYDTRRGSRERWRSDDRFDRERSMRDRDDRDERGFFERAGDEIASWFGDDDAERRRRQEHQDRGDFRRDRSFDQPRSSREHWNRDDDVRGRWRDDDERGMFSTSSYRGYGGEGAGRATGGGFGGETFSDRDYKPMTGDYGRGEFERPRSRTGGRDDFRRPTFSGSSERAYDPHYSNWRNRQIDELDRDYDEYRRENQSKFESDFGSWRTQRQGKRQMLGSVREHMEVLGSDEQHVGTVDRVAGDRIILTKSDPESGGTHHSIPCSLIDRVEDQKVILDCDADKAKERWRDDSRERALFEREDQGDAGPMNLERSFSGTYR